LSSHPEIPPGFVVDPTPDREAEALRVVERLEVTADAELTAVARLLAGKGTGGLPGRAEYEARDRVHAAGAARC